MCSKSSFLLIVGIGKSLSIDFALLVSLFSVVTILSLGLPLNLFSNSPKQNDKNSAFISSFLFVCFFVHDPLA